MPEKAMLQVARSAALPSSIDLEGCVKDAPRCGASAFWLTYFYRLTRP